MNSGVFKQLLCAGKIFDVNDSPLRLLHHPGDSPVDDSYFRSVSSALYGHEGERIALRASCLLRFIRLVFYASPVSVQEFLDDMASEASVSRWAYQDNAIQVWLIKHTHYSRHEVGREYTFSAHRVQLKQYALDFIRQNNQLNILSCRFTFGYLLASIYPITLHYYDQLSVEDDLVYIQPAIHLSTVRRGDPPGTKHTEKQLHIYIWYDALHFKLLVPVPVAPVSRISCAQATRMKARPHKYQLRKSIKETQNLPVAYFTPMQSNDQIHCCTLNEGQLQEHLDAIYMVFPSDGHVQLQIDADAHLFICCVRESHTDVKPRLECLVELSHDITYPYFLLEQDTKHVIVTVSKLVRTDVLRSLEPLFMV